MNKARWKSLERTVYSVASIRIGLVVKLMHLIIAGDEIGSFGQRIFHITSIVLEQLQRQIPEPFFLSLHNHVESYERQLQKEIFE